MYRDIDLVVVLVDDAYDLLITLRNGAVGILCRGWHSDETSELSDAEIDMHDEVARLHLLQLLHGEGHLASLGTLTLQLVFVETLENLVVSEEDCHHGVIDKTFVQSTLDGRRQYLSGGGVDEYLLKTLLLLVAVGEDESPVAPVGVFAQRL